MSTSFTSSLTSREQIIDAVRTTRNDLIKNFLDECFLRDYLADKYLTFEIAPIQLALIKAELKELLIEPVDVNYYLPLIRRMEATGHPFSGDERGFFYQEILKTIKKIIYTCSKDNQPARQR